MSRSSGFSTSVASGASGTRGPIRNGRLFFLPRLFVPPHLFVLTRFFILTLLAALSLSFGIADSLAQAKPLGGGKSVGKQSKSVTTERKPQVRPAKDFAIEQPSARVAVATPALAAAPIVPAAPRWLAPLSGVAAGLGLSALASHFGFAEEIGAFIAFMLVLTVIMLIIRFAVLPRRSPAAQQFFTPNYSYAGVGEEAVVAQQYTPSLSSMPAQQVVVIRPMLPERSNDAGSRWRIPNDFDVETFLRGAKSQYVRLQAAHDSADLEQLRDFTTPGLFEQIRQEINSQRPVQRKTDIIGLKAELLGISDEPTEHMACVRFQGFLREQTALVGEPFDEVWNLTKTIDGSSGWLLAGVQQLDTVH